MNSTIIDFITYREENDLDAQLGPSSISKELITEIQILIQRLRNSNPIKQPVA